MLTGKTVLLGVTGSIAAYKIPSLARLCKKAGAQVHVMMTPNATEFIAPLTFESLTGTKCLIDTFDRNFKFNVEHIAVAKQADIVMVAPASANVIGKLVHGIADDMLTTTVMACPCAKIISPAMNHNMYYNPVVQDNIKLLQNYGWNVIEPETGTLANGDTGHGRMPEPEILFKYICAGLTAKKDLSGKKVLVTAGPTREALDPVRFITNHSTGKMGYALAKMAMLRGAEVTLISGPVRIAPPNGVTFVPVVSAKDMFEAVTARFEEQDIIIKAAAVADYRPQTVSDEKIKKKDSSSLLELVRTDDILAYLGQHRKEGQMLCGFSMETENMIENSRAKLRKKHADLIVANSLRQEGAGFGSNTNIVTLITEKTTTELQLMSKEEVADVVLDHLLQFHR